MPLHFKRTIFKSKAFAVHEGTRDVSRKQVIQLFLISPTTKEPFRQVTPTTARSRHSQQTVHEQTTVAALTPFALATTRHERFDTRPLIVPKSLAFHQRPPKEASDQNRASPGVLNRHYDLEYSEVSAGRNEPRNLTATVAATS